LKCDSTRAKTRFRRSAKRTSPFKSVGALVQSTTGSRGVRISGSNGNNVGYTMFQGSVKGTGYPIHSPVSPSLPLSCVTVCHHIATGLYRVFSGGKVRPGVLLTIHPLLVPRSWKSRAIPLPTLWGTPGLQRDHFTLFIMEFTRCIILIDLTQIFVISSYYVSYSVSHSLPNPAFL